MDVIMETIECQVWINVPVCPEQLVALPESIVEKHIDPFKGQLCVVDGLRLCLLLAPRRSVGWGRHWDTLHRRRGGGRGVGGVRSVKLLYSNAQASRPVTQFCAADAAMFTTFCQPANERSLLGFGRCSVCCRPPAGVYVPATDWTHTGNAEHFEASEFSTLLLYVVNITVKTLFLMCGRYWK